MASVVFLRAINVGGANLCKPAALAKELSKYDIVNIGAVGTFVVRKNVIESVLRSAIAKKLPFRCEIMICPARAILDVAQKNPFAREPSGPEFTRFVSVLHAPPPKRPRLPLVLPEPEGVASSKPARRDPPSNQTSNLKPQTSANWLLKIIAIPDRFVLGIYRRQMKAIGHLGKIEKILGVPGTVRNWNTIEKVVKILGEE